MYPQQFWSLFPPFPRTLQVFVAMSFAPEFDARWKQVIEPAICAIRSDGQELKAYRVDLSNKNDAILLEVLESIGSSLLIFADITATGELEGRPVRNANVMYELGLAHAVRLPNEVIVFRSDKYPLDFDIAGVRVTSYDPTGDIKQAKKDVQTSIINALSGQKATKRASVELALQRMTLPALNALYDAFENGTMPHPAPKTFRDVPSATERSQAIELLLELGMIRATPLQVDETMWGQFRAGKIAAETAMLTYCGTAFGRAVLDYVGETSGVHRWALLDEMKKAERKE
jgi:hypothetical protein